MRGTHSLLAILLLCTAGTAHARNSRMGLLANRMGLALGNVSSLSAAPATVTFYATNPNSGAVAGSSQATISWQVVSGSHLQGWSLSVQAASASFMNCSQIPASAVQVSCSAAPVSGGNGSGTCGGPAPLSTTLQQVAGGAEGDNTNTYTVYLTFTLAESWRYVANSSCTLSLTYSVNAQ